jgi:hypothetical protein
MKPCVLSQKQHQMRIEPVNFPGPVSMPFIRAASLRAPLQPAMAAKALRSVMRPTFWRRWGEVIPR